MPTALANPCARSSVEVEQSAATPRPSDLLGCAKVA
jgi:hypothetical protein